MMICARAGELLPWKRIKLFRQCHLIATGHFTFRPMRLFLKSITRLFEKLWESIRMIARSMGFFFITNIFMAPMITWVSHGDGTEGKSALYEMIKTFSLIVMRKVSEKNPTKN